MNNPLRTFAIIWGLRKLTPLEQASAELEQAKRDLLNASAQREHAAALESMLGRRIARLVDTVKTFADDDGVPS